LLFGASILVMSVIVFLSFHLIGCVSFKTIWESLLGCFSHILLTPFSLSQKTKLVNNC
jgi:hypothetical protein